MSQTLGKQPRVKKGTGTFFHTCGSGGVVMKKVPVPFFVFGGGEAGD